LEAIYEDGYFALSISAKTTAIRGVFDESLEIHEGEMMGFVGTNGSGKTTTIRCLMGFIKPTSGAVYTSTGSKAMPTPRSSPNKSAMFRAKLPSLIWRQATTSSARKRNSFISAI
jgi:ABC-type uncharacterized transport system ATPase subunit